LKARPTKLADMSILFFCRTQLFQRSRNSKLQLVPRRKNKTLPADDQAAIGQMGIAATRALIPGEHGRVTFSVPVLGEEAWVYLADEPIETGNRVRVIAVLVSDQGERVLKVEKVL